MANKTKTMTVGPGITLVIDEDVFAERFGGGTARSVTVNGDTKTENGVVVRWTVTMVQPFAGHDALPRAPHGGIPPFIAQGMFPPDMGMGMGMSGGGRVFFPAPTAPATPQAPTATGCTGRCTACTSHHHK